MGPQTIKGAVWLTGWTALLIGTLSLASLPGDWGHDVCGPWGCGPPSQALLACHLSWLVVFVPAAWLLRRFASRPVCRNVGILMIGIALAAMAGIAVHQRMTWLPTVSEWHQLFFWHRTGFVIVTLVELPLLALLPAGMVLLWPPSRAVARTDTGHDDTANTNHDGAPQTGNDESSDTGHNNKPDVDQHVPVEITCDG
jgi:hypothetical protein